MFPIQTVDERVLKALGAGMEAGWINNTPRSSGDVAQGQVWALARYAVALEDRLAVVEAKLKLMEGEGK